MIRVGIIGAKGYTAGVLMRLLLRHGQSKIAHLAARVEKPEDVAVYFPDLRGRVDIPIKAIDIQGVIADTDAVFLALPHTVSQEYAPPLLEAGKAVFDLGSDFRFRDVAVYDAAYGVKHACPELSRRAVYGLPEFYREKIKAARLVGVPGCYPTSVLLALGPFLRNPAGVDLGSVIADSKSGVSGAGRIPSDTTHFCEANESLRAYKVAAHRHAPEIEEVMSDRAGRPLTLTFVPHLSPMDHGIHSTVYLSVEARFTESEARERLQEFYAAEPFVRVMPEGYYPATKDVVGTNYCDIAVKVDSRNRRMVLCSVIDNLVKGASGQAIQCMNIALGLRETEGLL